MGLADRHYMREPTSPWRFSATVTLVILLVIAFILQKAIIHPYFEAEYLELSLDGIRHGYVWELLSFQFLHSTPLHLILNAFTLWMFGREVEDALGKLRFLALYLLSGVIGGLFQILLSFMWPAVFGGGVVGASAGVFGVIAAFAMLGPNRILTMLLFFIIPVNMRAIMLVWLSVGISVFGILFAHRNGDNVAHAAHLGGIITGVLFMKYGLRLSDNISDSFESRRQKRDLIRAVSIKIPKWPQGKSEGSGEVSEQEFISREVDPILDKISQHGIQSLTEHERKVLEAARNKMAKR
jgi:membrane associated rhomboid family serine protease